MKRGVAGGGGTTLGFIHTGSIAAGGQILLGTALYRLGLVRDDPQLNSRSI